MLLLGVWLGLKDLTSGLTSCDWAGRFPAAEWAGRFPAAVEDGFGWAAAAALGPVGSSSSEEMTMALAQPSESRWAREVSFST